MQLKGRHLVLLWLLAFLAVAVIVTARQTRAYRLADTLNAASNRRDALEAEAAELSRRIQEASSRPILGRKVEAMGMRVPSDSEGELFYLPPETVR
ncbi:MAG TPA: hypothetical protein VK012_04750 [Gemmatimonadales bacterium]|nr:hypothetical protein [Gemmatimonadales bacterium]